jgi:hypothetical protein
MQVWSTAYQLVVLLANVQPGDTVLVHAAASSVGLVRVISFFLALPPPSFWGAVDMICSKLFSLARTHIDSCLEQLYLNLHTFFLFFLVLFLFFPCFFLCFFLLFFLLVQAVLQLVRSLGATALATVGRPAKRDAMLGAPYLAHAAWVVDRAVVCDWFFFYI